MFSVNIQRITQHVRKIKCQKLKRWNSKVLLVFSIVFRYTQSEILTHTLGADALEDVGGVYIFTKMEANPNGVKTYSPLYIGQTQSFKQRITGQHETLPCIAQNGANRLCVLEVENLFSRQAIEADLLCRINTPCNRMQ